MKIQIIHHAKKYNLQKKNATQKKPKSFKIIITLYN
jgi:hypothetical protein